MATVSIPSVFCIDSPVFKSENLDVSKEIDRQTAECRAMEWEFYDMRQYELEVKMLNAVQKMVEYEDEDENTKWSVKAYEYDNSKYEILRNGEVIGRTELIDDDEQRMIEYIKEDEGIFHFVPHILMSNLIDPIRARIRIENEDESDDEEETEEIVKHNDEDRKECPVCLCDFEGENWCEGKCGHRFCNTCFSNFDDHNICRCPLCRMNWEDEEEDEDEESEYDEIEWEESDIQEMLEQQDDALLDIIDIEALARDAVNFDGLRHCINADDEAIIVSDGTIFRMLFWQH